MGSVSRPPPGAGGAPEPGPRPGGLTLSGRDFARLRDHIEERYGIRLPPAKKVLLESRLGQRVRDLGFPDFTAYCDHVLGGGAADELVELADRVTTNKTDFFREPRHFEILEQEVLRALAPRLASRELRVWSCACSTGEEPYTLAMVLSEAATRIPGLRFRVLASDLSTRVLRRAQQGVYTEEQVAPIPLALRRRYLLRSVTDEAVVRVRRELRAQVQFRQLNLLDPDNGIHPQVDVIFCRNVLIYFDRPMQRRVLGGLTRTLAPGGYLFLGHSESMNGMDLPYEVVSPTVYRLRGREDEEAKGWPSG